jgi:hypothetical protein
LLLEFKLFALKYCSFYLSDVNESYESLSIYLFLELLLKLFANPLIIEGLNLDVYAYGDFYD